MLNKRQEKILFGIVGTTVALLVLVSIFIWPNFYAQYKAIKGVTITDITNEEYAVLKRNLGDLLPDITKVQKASMKLRSTESWFDVVFELSEEQSQTLIASLTDYTQNNDYLSTQTLTVNDKEYEPNRCFQNNDFNNEIAVLEYSEVQEKTVIYQIVWKNYPSEISDIFYERIRIVPKWLYFY